MMAASRKQEIYKDMMFWSLPMVRNVWTWPWWAKIQDRTCYYEAELIHNLCQSILEPEFVPHDIHFLNYQAKMFCDNGKRSANYDKHVRLIRELFDLVPERLRPALKWNGPSNQTS
jgi:hypothetical protein